MNTTTMNTNMNVAEGDFSALLLDEHTRVMLDDAYQAVTTANRWGYLRRPDVPGTKPCLHCKGRDCTGRYMEDAGFQCMCAGHCRICGGKGYSEQGFMMLDAREMKDIDIHMTYSGHSGSSYGWTMRQMESIAKNGWDAYVATIGTRPPVPILTLPAAPALAPAPPSNFKDFLDAVSPSTKGYTLDTTLTPEQKREKFLALPTNMTLDEQVKALRQLGDVPMSYSEMRSRFG